MKVVKNKVSPPFKIAEFDILYGVGISREGSLIDLGVEQAIVRKSGAWYTYEGDQLGQGKENARNFLRDNPDLANEIEKKIKEKLGIGARLDADRAQSRAQRRARPRSPVLPPGAPGGRAQGGSGRWQLGGGRPRRSAIRAGPAPPARGRRSRQHRSRPAVLESAALGCRVTRARRIPRRSRG